MNTQSPTCRFLFTARQRSCGKIFSVVCVCHSVCAGDPIWPLPMIHCTPLYRPLPLDLRPGTSDGLQASGTHPMECFVVITDFPRYLDTGYKVITFKNPYLGNTCVPFQHWACSLHCAQNIEIPARLEQIAAARELDRQYDAYIRDCQKHYNSHVPMSLRFTVRNQSVSNVSHASQRSLHTSSSSEEDVGSITSSCIGQVKPCHCSISWGVAKELLLKVCSQ